MTNQGASNSSDDLRMFPPIPGSTMLTLRLPRKKPDRRRQSCDTTTDNDNGIERRAMTTGLLR
jgi:hypothetical protein